MRKAEIITITAIFLGIWFGANGTVTQASATDDEAAEAPEQSVGFSDRERVARLFDEQPLRVVELLETILTQAQVDALEQALFPAPTASEKAVRLGEVKQELRRLGLKDDDELVRAVADRIELLETEETGR